LWVEPEQMSRSSLTEQGQEQKREGAGRFLEYFCLNPNAKEKREMCCRFSANVQKLSRPSSLTESRWRVFLVQRP
jgi:hypothetical protein